MPQCVRMPLCAGIPQSLFLNYLLFFTTKHKKLSFYTSTFEIIEIELNYICARTKKQMREIDVGHSCAQKTGFLQYLDDLTKLLFK